MDSTIRKQSENLQRGLSYIWIWCPKCYARVYFYKYRDRWVDEHGHSRTDKKEKQTIV